MTRKRRDTKTTPCIPVQQRKAQLRHEIQSLRHHLRQNPRDVDVLIQLGDRLAEMATYRAAGFRLKRAREAYFQAMVLAPDNPIPVNNLGVVLCDSGSYRKALRLFDRALSLDPADATIHENRSIAEFYLGRRNHLFFPDGLQRGPRTHSAYFDPQAL
jgi:Flp pilus assembly protein TadD